MNKNYSSDIGSFDSFRSKLFVRVISRFKSFLLNEYDLRILSSVSLMEMLNLRGKNAETREISASESLQKVRTKFYEVARPVGRVKTAVTKHLRKMFRSRMHKAAERNTGARINSHKLTKTNS